MMRIFLLLVVLVLISSFPFLSNWYSGKRLDGIDESYLSAMIDEYVKKNPKKILDSLMDYQVLQFEEQQKQKEASFEEAILKNKKSLINFAYPSFLNKDGGINVIEFFDVACGYCKIASGKIASVMEEVKDVNYIFRNLPVLGESSFLAAEYDNGFYLFLSENNTENKEELYKSFYLSLVSYDGKYTEESITSIMQNLGVDVAKFKEYFVSNRQKITEMVHETIDLAKDLGIKGVPVVIVENKILHSVSEESIKEAIENAKKDSKKS